MSVSDAVSFISPPIFTSRPRQAVWPAIFTQELDPLQQHPMPSVSGEI